MSTLINYVLTTTFTITSHSVTLFILKWIMTLSTLILIYMLYSAYIYPTFFSKTRHLPGPGIFELSFLERYYIVRPSDVKDMTQRQLDRIRQYGPIVRYIGIFNEERVLISDPKSIRKILLSNSYNYQKMDRFSKGFKLVLGDGLLMTDGDLHKRMRKITNKTIQLGQVKGLLPSMIQPVQKMVHDWVNVLDGIEKYQRVVASTVGEVDGSDDFGTDFEKGSPIGLLGMIRPFSISKNNNSNKIGKEEDSDDDDDDKQPKVVIDIMRAMDEVTRDIIGLACLGVTFSDERWQKIGLLEAFEISLHGGTTVDKLAMQFLPGYMDLPVQRVVRVRNAFETTRRFVRDQVRTKTKALTAKYLQDQETATEMSLEGLGVKSLDKVSQRIDNSISNHDDSGEQLEKDHHVDFLSAMIKNNLESAHLEPHHRLTETELVDQVVTFLAAGHETTAASICWVMYMLSIHPEIQQKLRQEFDTHLPHNDTASLTYEAISTLPYLDAVLNESMRVHPAVPAIGRVSIEDDVLCDQKIYAGTTVVIHMAALQKLKSVWGEDAEEFIPERWLDKDREEQVTAAKKWAFMPFISGTRVCVGQKMAILEMKLLIHAMVSNFVFEPTPGFKWKKSLMLAWRPTPGMHLVVSKVKRQR